MLRPLALGLLAAALLAAPVPALADGSTAPTVTVDAPVVTAGDTATLSGTAAPGATVSLFGYSSPSTSYVLQRQATVAPDGAYAFHVAPATNSRYYVSDADGSTSHAVALLVRTAVALDEVVVVGDRLTVSGRLLPRAAARVSVVLTRDDERTVVATTPADPRAGFRTTVATGRRGAFLVSAAVAATRDNVAGESAAQQVVLTPAQAAAVGQPG